MDKRIKILTVLFLVFVAFVSGVYAAIQLGTIEFAYEIMEFKATMSPSPVNIDLGAIMKDASNTVSSSDTGSDLTVNVATDIDVTLGDLGGFNVFSCTVELRQDTTTKYFITVSKTTPTGTMSSVAVGVYDIWVEYSYTAGSSATTGTVTVTLSYP